MKCDLGKIKTDEEVKSIEIKVEGLNIDFRLAEKISKLIAKEKNFEMLIAWYDPKRDIHYPNVDCCGDDEPAWYIYGKSRGGKLLIDVNDYLFFFV
jgi:hypothetical protein